jgi:hypothetical protein
MELREKIRIFRRYKTRENYDKAKAEHSARRKEAYEKIKHFYLYLQTQWMLNSAWKFAAMRLRDTIGLEKVEPDCLYFEEGELYIMYSFRPDRLPDGSLQVYPEPQYDRLTSFLIRYSKPGLLRDIVRALDPDGVG